MIGVPGYCRQAFCSDVKLKSGLGSLISRERGMSLKAANRHTRCAAASVGMLAKRQQKGTEGIKHA